MDARSSEPGLDIPQTRQRLEPALTSAPQPLQAKANIAPESLIRTARTLRRRDYSASKARKKVPISGRLLLFIVLHRCSRAPVPAEAGVSVIGRPYRLLGNPEVAFGAPEGEGTGSFALSAAMRDASPVAAGL
jgi:hypothetical protein